MGVGCSAPHRLFPSTLPDSSVTHTFHVSTRGAVRVAQVGWDDLQQIPKGAPEPKECTLGPLGVESRVSADLPRPVYFGGRPYVPEHDDDKGGPDLARADP